MPLSLDRIDRRQWSPSMGTLTRASWRSVNDRILHPPPWLALLILFTLPSTGDVGCLGDHALVWTTRTIGATAELRVSVRYC